MSATIQNASHLEIDENVLELFSIETVGLLQIVRASHAHHVQRELGHFTGLVFDGQRAQYAVNENVFV